MKLWSRLGSRVGSSLAVIVVAAVALMLALGTRPVMAQPRAHVYLFRGLADVYSLGMNTLADELNARGVHATAHSHTDWKSIADTASADYKTGKEGPIILVGHSLGADAVMEMADYLGDKGVPVALVVPFDGTQSFPAPANVGRVLNFTQRDYAYMRPGVGFHGSLSNVDLSADRSIDHVTIDKSPQLHARVINEVLAIVGGHRMAAPAGEERAKIQGTKSEGTKIEGTKIERTPATDLTKPVPNSSAPKTPAAPVTSLPPQKPIAAPEWVKPTEIPD